ncbi:MAG: TlpA family protein disulfide reductase [Bacteriovoracaceae bacterium]|jgi:thiol-disulfide isomerase/thioredoxin|nr:TlpA family protein disulfide reductase [Bacteriovoracaceae bacterium]
MKKLALLVTLLFCQTLLAKKANHYPQLKDFKTGAEHDLSQYRGKKIIVYNFWASWCTSCIGELPQLVELQKKYANKDIVFFGINAGERKKDIKRFNRRHKFPYTILLDPDKSFSKSLEIFNLPRTLVIGKDGSMVFSGNRPPAEIKTK